MKNVHIITLGCSKNSVDSEHLAGQMASVGLKIVEDLEDANLVLVNTCGFIQMAVEEGISVILDLEDLKKEGKIEAIAIAGCMVNRYGDDLKKEFPTVDYWCRSEGWEGLLNDLGYASMGYGRTILTRTPWTRYLKVSEGCDTKCSFCAIPSIRGSLRSVPMESLVREAIGLVENGAKEICMVGQDLTVYGKDLYGTPSLPSLLDELEKNLPDDIWLRLFYLHPARVDRPFLERVLSSSKIVPWLDIPIQHVDDEILKRMHRPPVEEHIKNVLKTARELSPDFTLRTTLMVGFPGETRSQFEKLLDFVEEVRFDRLGAFAYSKEDGTPAAAFSDQIPDDEKERRYQELMELQRDISLSRQMEFVGRKLDLLVEDIDPEDGTRWGRTFRDAPEIDGVVSVANCDAKLGDKIKILVSDASEYDLFGEPCDE